jgi:inosine-uridine nucleoside N-ribohydrolase
MGGSFAEAEAQPEFNAHCDPEAAHIVLSANWPVRMIGLNITQQVLFRREEFAALSAAHPAVALLKRQADGWIDRVEGMGWEQGGCALHDALAVAAVLDESLFTWRETAVHVELNDKPQRGAMHFQPPTAGTNIQVAVSVDADRCHDLIWGWVQNEEEQVGN